MNIPDKIWKIVSAVLIMLFVFLIAISAKEFRSIGYVGHNPQNSQMITVDGTGEAVSIPDVATFSFTVTETSPTVAAAQTKATEKINNALKAVRESGVEDKDISTLSYSINPHYEYENTTCATNVPCRPGKQVLTGYDVSQSVQVKVRDLAKAGALFTSIGSLNVQNVNGLDFAVDKPESIKAKARGLAIENAQKKADELSRQLGVKLVRIVSFNEMGGDRPYPMYYSGKGGIALDSVAAAAPEIPVGTQKVVSNVTITYEIE